MKGRGVIVTGGLGVLGQAVASLAVSRGAAVVAIDSKRTPHGAGDWTTLNGVDLRLPSEASEAIEHAANKLGQVHALINVAGGFRWQMLEGGSAETWMELHALNVMTTVNACRAALPHLLRSGSGAIVNVGADAAIKADAGMGPYAASKAGIHKLTESLASELKGKRVRVNAVLPSILDTPANRADMPDADFTKWVKPQSLAEVILFLSSEKARDVTGALIPVVGLC